MPIEIEVPVAWGDMDALGHVNNTVYLRWFESARIAFFSALGIDTRAQQVGPILARTSVDFRRPVVHPDTVRVSVRATKIGTTSLTMAYVVTSLAQGAVAAEGDSVIVLFDYAKGEKTPIPEDLRRAIERLGA